MKRKRTRSEIIYEVALGGISSAMALLLVWLSVIVPYGTIGFYVAACCALLVPLTQKYYIATISAYIVSSLLAFAIVGDILLISGYVVYFAPMSIISGVMLEKKVKPYISYPVKVVYIGLALAFLYYVAGTIMISKDIIGEVPFWAVELVGIVALLLVDFLMGYVYKAIGKKVSKVLRKRQKQQGESEEDDTDDNPFSFDDEMETPVNKSNDGDIDKSTIAINEDEFEDNEGGEISNDNTLEIEEMMVIDDVCEDDFDDDEDDDFVV